MIIHSSIIFAEENAKVTFIDEDGCLKNKHIYVKTFDFLIEKQTDVDTLFFEGNKDIQTFSINKSDTIGYFNFYDNSDSFLCSALLSESDSVVISMKIDTTGNYEFNNIYYNNPYFNFLVNKINVYNDDKFYEVYYKYDIPLLFKYADSIRQSNLDTFYNDSIYNENNTVINTFFLGTIKYSYVRTLMTFLTKEYYYKDRTDSLLEHYTFQLFHDDTMNVYNDFSKDFSFQSYIFYTRMAIYHKYKDEYPRDNYKSYISAHIDKFKEHFKGLFEQKIIYDFLFDVASDARNMKEIAYLTELIDSLEKENMSNIFIKQLRNLIENMSKTMPGNILKDYDFVDVNNQPVKLSDYFNKGRYVYVNIWATWCGPCLHYIKFEKELVEKFKDQDITFLNITLEKMAYKDWLAFITKKGVKGEQVLYQGNLKSQLAKDLMIDGIPKFMLLDKDGSIINPNACNPEDELLLEDFKKIGIE